jgi:hypothetical protein
MGRCQQEILEGRRLPDPPGIPAQLILAPPRPEDPEPDLAASQPNGLTNRRMRTRMSGGVRGGGVTPPPTRFPSTARFGSATTCSTVLLDLIDCPVGPRQVTAPLRRRLPLRSVTAMDFCPPSAWNGSWDDAQNNPSAAGAVSAIACAIGAASVCVACEHTSCKRLVSGSNPLTGSQRSSRLTCAYLHV